MAISEQQIQSALRKLSILAPGKDYVTSNEARNIKIDDNDVSLDIVLGYPAKSVIEGIRKQVTDRLKTIPGIGGLMSISRARLLLIVFNGGSSSYPE